MLLLSTEQPILCVSKNLKRKPSINKLYDYTKSGTDIVDQRMGTYALLSVAAFAPHVLDTCRVNASTITGLNKGHDFRKQKIIRLCVGSCF